jgi:hypothetical protein
MVWGLLVRLELERTNMVWTHMERLRVVRQDMERPNLVRSNLERSGMVLGFVGFGRPHFPVSRQLDEHHLG